jgi:hypothetical protein
MNRKDFIDLVSFSNQENPKALVFKIVQLLFVLYCMVHLIEAGIVFYNHMFK